MNQCMIAVAQKTIHLMIVRSILICDFLKYDIGFACIHVNIAVNITVILVRRIAVDMRLESSGPGKVHAHSVETCVETALVISVAVAVEVDKGALVVMLPCPQES